MNDKIATLTFKSASCPRVEFSKAYALFQVGCTTDELRWR